MYVSVYGKWTWLRYRESGFLKTAKRIGEVVRQNLLQNKAHIFCCELAQLREPEFQLPPDYTVQRIQSEQEIQEDDMKEFFPMSSEKIFRRQLKERFARQATLWLVRVNGVLACFQWSVPRAPMTHWYHPFTENDVYLFDGGVFKPYRGKGVMFAVHKHILATLRREGYIRAFSAAYEWNKPGIRSAVKLGMIAYGIARKLHIFGRDIVIWYDMHNRKYVEPREEGASKSS